MASTVTNLTQYFIDGATEALSYRLANVDKFAYIVNKQGCYVNDYVRIPFISASAASVGTYSHTTGYTAQDSYVAGVSVQLTDWLVRPYDVTDTDAAHITPEVMKRLSAKNANLLANDIVTKLLLNTSSSFGNYTQASGSSWASTTGIIGLSTSASVNRWSQDEQYLITGPELYWKAAGNTTTLVANAYGQPDVVQNGVLSRYYGWQPTIVDSLPSTVKGIALTKDAVALATSLPIPQNQNNLQSVDVVSLPNGINIQLISYYDPIKRKSTFAAELITGYAALNTSAGFNILVTNMNV